MNISKDGKVIVIDDKIKEVQPLLNVFTKFGIPYLYYSGEYEYLPNENTELTPRFIFLDLNLSINTTSSSKNDRSTLLNVLNLVIKKDNIPYALILWSKSDSELRGILDDIFNKELSAKQPFIKIDLEKANYFNFNPQNGTWELKRSMIETINSIQEKIEIEFKNLESLNFILQWENISHCSISETSNLVFNLTIKDNEKNKSLKELLYKLAEAHWGQQIEINSYSKPAAIILNNLFTEINELSLFEKIDNELLKIDAIPTEFSHEKVSVINTNLLLANTFLDRVLPGNVYIGNKDELKTELMESILNKPKIKEDNIVKEDLFKDPLYIEVEVSPLCDFSQKKQKKLKILPGLLIEQSKLSYFNPNVDFIFKSPFILYNNKPYRILLDLRFFDIVENNYFDGHTAFTRIRQNLLNEIQFHLAKNISRIGVTFIDKKK